jgi:hypothetical protein
VVGEGVRWSDSQATRHCHGCPPPFARLHGIGGNFSQHTCQPATCQHEALLLAG